MIIALRLRLTDVVADIKIAYNNSIRDRIYFNVHFHDKLSKRGLTYALPAGQMKVTSRYSPALTGSFWFFSNYCAGENRHKEKIATKKIHKTQLKPPPWWKPVLLRLLPRHRKSKYNDSTAVEYTITHDPSIGMLSMGITTDNSDISCVMSLWAIFHPLGHPSMIVADHTTSTPWITPRYYKHSFKIT